MNEIQRKRKIAYQAVVASPDGKTMMEDLIQHFGGSSLKRDKEGRMDATAMIFRDGGREVLLHIERMARSEDNALDG